MYSEEKEMGEPNISEEITVVLVGRTGNGKSATGNSIIGVNVFDSMPSSAGVTATCQLHKTVLDNDQIINVIDTPGLFDSSIDSKSIGTEIAKCIQMAKNGIHAVLVVLSVTTRFSQEEVSVIECLKQFFGGKFGDYMIVVFAHGDALGKRPLAEYLGPNCPEPLLKFLEMCGNRYVLFDNKTEDETKKSQQRKELFHLVDTVVLNNGGVAYSNELFVDSLEMSENGVKFNKAYEELLLEKIESKLHETIQRVEKQLADEQAARKQAEAMALEAHQKSIAEITRLSEQLEISRRDAEIQRKTQIESEKKLKEKFEAEQKKLEQDVKKKLEEAQRKEEMLRKTRRESELKLKESNERFAAEQHRLQMEIQNKGNCAIL
ncbi:hypothetical protein ACS0TY_028582 [Phlomoides rotata]